MPSSNVSNNGKMTERIELDPVHQDRPLGDIGVSEDKEVNKNDK